MGKLSYTTFTTPSGDEMIVMPRAEFDELRDALDAAETGVDAAQGLRALLPEAQGGDAAQGAAQLGEALGLAGAVDEGAVALGAAVDHWLPQARSLPEALRALHLAAPR